MIQDQRRSIPEAEKPLARTERHSIGFAGSSESAIIAGLIASMDRHYRPEDELRRATDYEAVVRRTLETQEGTRFAVARVGERPVGLACIAILRPGRDLMGLIYLKDLFVVEEARGQGVGRRLMQFLAAFAAAEGIARIDFTADRENVAAQRLYASLGAVAQEKVYFSLAADPALPAGNSQHG
jgi:GNAT superfamily N-acetyltransferase